MVSPILEELGLLGIGDTTDAMLDGTYVPPVNTTPELSNILKHLKCSDNIVRHRQPTPITCDAYRKGRRGVKEIISSSPSKLHTGHWKRGSLDPSINWVNTSLANIPFLSGYSPKRCQHGINVMIEKAKGNYRVDKLRTILLYKVDFNMNNKYLVK